jgi:hypothetical protein
MPAVRSDWKKSKALEWLVEHVEVVDPEGQPIDRTLLDLTPEPDGSADTDSTDSTDPDSTNSDSTDSSAIAQQPQTGES